MHYEFSLHIIRIVSGYDYFATALQSTHYQINRRLRILIGYFV